MELYKIIKGDRKYIYESKISFQRGWKTHTNTVTRWRSYGMVVDFKGYKLACNEQHLDWKKIKEG